MKMIRLFIGIVLLIEGSLSFLAGQESDSDVLAAKMETAWTTVWTKFYSPETNLFYDFIESYEPGRELAHLPEASEVAALSPNVCGYGTGMEDCAISGGVLLSMVLDRYAVTGEEFLQDSARDIFAGLEKLETVHGSAGFIARGISPKSPGAVYINSSRDQVTHAVYSVWEYYRSPLADDAMKIRIRKFLTEVADRMKRNVTAENDYDFLCADGSRCRYGISRMYCVNDHEAARLPMIYAAAWDATGDAEYWNLYRRYLPEAVASSVHLAENQELQSQIATYALLQMQVSLSLLDRLESDETIKKDIRRAMKTVSEICVKRSRRVLETMKGSDLTVLAPDWRKAGGLNGDYRRVWYAVREAGELALTQLLTPEISFDENSRADFYESLLLPDYRRISTCGVYDLLGGYWKARREGILP